VIRTTKILTILGLSLLPVGVTAAEGGPRTREFLFTYQTTVTGLNPGQTARIWLPVPPSNQHQEATLVTQQAPVKGSIAMEPRFGNRIIHFEAKAGKDGKIPISLTYRIKRQEVKANLQGKNPLKEDLELFLKPDAKVPIGGKPLTLVAGIDLPQDQLKLGRVFYDVVNNHMRYSKEGIGWGQGDAVWACDSKFGNCSDFHSLFISLARSHKIPAKFEMGFPLPEKRGQGEIGGYHCWAWFQPAGKGWVPVDISEANKNPRMKDYYFGNLTEDRVTFTTGRDLTLVPKQDGPVLNFLIYPYVEVDGKPYAAEKVQRKFAFEDVKPTEK
jgi:transglutaminase-like putative cysteine protease